MLLQQHGRGASFVVALPAKAALRRVCGRLLPFPGEAARNQAPSTTGAKVPSKSPFEKTLRFVPPALASFHPRHRAASGRAWWSTSLAARPPSRGRLAHPGRSAHSQIPTSTDFTYVSRNHANGYAFIWNTRVLYYRKKGPAAHYTNTTIPPTTSPLAGHPPLPPRPFHPAPSHSSHSMHVALVGADPVDAFAAAACHSLRQAPDCPTRGHTHSLATRRHRMAARVLIARAAAGQTPRPIELTQSRGLRKIQSRPPPRRPPPHGSSKAESGHCCALIRRGV